MMQPKIEDGLVGALIAVLVGFASMPIWVLAEIDGMYWFIFTIWFLMPIGYLVGWYRSGK